MGNRTKSIYLASSWRNKYYEHTLQLIRSAGYGCYDFRNPESAFSWDRLKDINPPNTWSPLYFRDSVMTHELAQAGYRSDMSALINCDTCVLLMPAGRSAHIEAGYARGAGKRLIVYLRTEDGGERFEPDLMHGMGELVISDYELLERLRAPW